MMTMKRVGEIAEKTLALSRMTNYQLMSESFERCFCQYSVNGKHSQSASTLPAFITTFRSRSGPLLSRYYSSSSKPTHSSNHIEMKPNESTLLSSLKKSQVLSEQPTASISRTSNPDSPGSGQTVPPLTPPPSRSKIEDARKESPSSGDAADRAQTHLLKTSLDQNLTLTGSHHDDVSILASRRIDPLTVRQVYYFDTLAFTKKLESRGFTREQAEGCAECLVEIINTTLDHQGRHMVTKPQQEIAVQQLMSEIVSVKKDMTLLQKSEFSSLKNETEKMSIELSQIQGHMNDEIVKLKGQFSLDINLERGRAIEAHAENEKKLQQLHNKIDTEVANLKTTFEIYRNDVFKYAGGSVIAVGTLMLGVIRLWH